MPPYGLRLPAVISLPLMPCWPLPQQLLPVSAAGGGRRRCTLRIFSGKNILNFGFQESLRTFLKPFFTGRVWNELPQSKPDGFDSSLWEGAFGMTGKFPAQAQSLWACLLPLGGAVAQRLRGFESAEPEKTVKRSSRRTGVNLQFFSV